MNEQTKILEEVAYHLHKLNASLTEAGEHGIDLTLRILAGREEDHNDFGEYNSHCVAQLRISQIREIV